jgi:uncharacterized protein (TIGR03437 family)
VPGPPHLRGLDLSVTAKVDAQAHASWWIINPSAQCQASVSFSCKWQAGDSQVNCGQDDAGAGCSATLSVPRDGTTKNLELRPVQRRYERWGAYSALARPQSSPRASQASLGAPTTQDVATTGSAGDNQELVQNTFPGASPQLVHSGGLDLLVWAYQNPALPLEQSTDIAWSTNDGTGWSPIAFIAQDTRLELSPVLAVDSNGNVVAAWQRVKDQAWANPISTLADLTALHKEIEVVYAAFNPNSRTWGPITQLTDDASFDTDLHLSADSAGNIMLSWLSNPDGNFTSTATGPSAVKYAFWTGSSFSSPAAATTGLIGVSRHTAAIKGSRAVIVIQRSVPAGSTGSVLDLLSWNGTTWLPTFNYVADGENLSPTAVIDNTGTTHVVWVRNGRLVHSTTVQTVPDVIRDVATSISFYDTRLLVNPAGNLTLIWQQATDDGSANLFARIFDPASSTWSSDVRLNTLLGTSHAAGGYYAVDGTLRLCYLQTQVERSSQLVSIANSPVLVDNIPTDGRTDIYTLSHFLAVDLAIANSDLQIAPGSPSAGAQVSAQVTVHNVGSLPVPFVHGHLYAGSAMVANVASESPLAAGDSRVLTAVFTYPASGGDISVAINESHEFTELTYDNNLAVVSLTSAAPVARILASAVVGVAPLTVSLDGTSSSDPAGSNLSFSWVFGDGSSPATNASISHVFSGPGVYPVLLNVTNAQGNSNIAQVTITAIAAGAPAVTADGVVDAAGFNTGISPGSLASLFGSRLSSVTGIVGASSSPLPLQLEGTSVTVNGIPAPLLAVVNLNGSEQINFQVPVEVDAPGQARIVVSSGGRDSAPIDVPALLAKPGIFTSGGAPIVTHNSDGTLVAESSPAVAGEVVVIWCTGLGAVAPPVATGSPASATVLSSVVLPVVVTIGGQESKIYFAGLAPGFVGLYQIDVEIPAGLGGTTASLVVEVSGSRSVAGQIAVHP